MAQNINLVRFEYNKISVEKFEENSTDLKITPNLNISSIEKIKLSEKKEFIKITFDFNIEYSNLGKIELKGKMFLDADDKSKTEIVDGWKNKKIDTKYNMLILNAIMQKATVKAIELADSMNLPLHIKLPTLQLDNKE